MANSTETQQRALWVAYFILGLALPILFWTTKAQRNKVRLQEVDQAHDITVEDSFPASDPPSAW